MSKIEFEQNWRYGYVLTYIMDSGSNRLYTTSPNIFALISADMDDLSKIKTIIFPKKITIFGSKMYSRGARSGSIEIAR